MLVLIPLLILPALAGVAMTLVARKEGLAEIHCIIVGSVSTLLVLGSMLAITAVPLVLR